LPTSIKWTVASIAVYNLGWGFADPFFSLYLSNFSDNYSIIGFYITLQSLIGAVMLIPLGDLLDRVRHSVIINTSKFGYIFVGAGYFLAGYWQSTLILVISLLLNGAFAAGVWSGTQATLRDNSTPKDSAITFGFYTTARQLTWIIGLVMGLWVIDRYPIYYIFIPVIVLPIVSILLGRKVKPKHFEPLASALKDIVFKDKLIVRFFRELRGFRPEMWLMFFFFFSSFLIPVFATSFIPLYAQSQGYSFKEIGLLVLVMNTPYLFSFIAAEVADHSERFRNIMIGFGISALAIAGLSIWHYQSWQFIALAFCFMSGYAIMFPSISGVASMLTPKKDTGTSTAAIDLIIFMSAVALSPLLGFFIDATGWRGTFLIISLILACLMIVTVIVHHIFVVRNQIFVTDHPEDKHKPYIL